VKERIKKLSEIKKTKNVNAFLFTSPASIKCFSGYFYNFETGPSPFHLLPAALFVSPFQKFLLLVTDSESDKLITLHPHPLVTNYSSYVYEEPRIVPYNTMVLQSGMVKALEPAVYKNDYGIRLEQLMLITKDGCEVFTKFNHCFEQGK
jgi:hypothetical protein